MPTVIREYVKVSAKIIVKPDILETNLVNKVRGIFSLVLFSHFSLEF